MSETGTFITGGRARDCASIVDLYGQDLIGIDIEEGNFSTYTCVVLVDKTTYVARVRVDAFGVPFPKCTEISRKTLEDHHAPAQSVQ